MTDIAEPLLTAAQLAQLVGLSRDTVYRQALRGDIPSHKFGRAVRFRLSEVTAAKTPAQTSWAQSRRSLARKRVA